MFGFLEQPASPSYGAVWPGMLGIADSVGLAWLGSCVDRLLPALTVGRTKLKTELHAFQRIHASLIPNICPPCPYYNQHMYSSRPTHPGGSFQFILRVPPTAFNQLPAYSLYSLLELLLGDSHGFDGWLWLVDTTLPMQTAYQAEPRRVLCWSKYA